MDNVVYKRVAVKDRLPNKHEYVFCIDYEGYRTFGTLTKDVAENIRFENNHRYGYDLIEYWLEEVELPNKETVEQYANELTQEDVFKTEEEIGACCIGFDYLMSYLEDGN